eukprot:scaffold100759_cov18-Tisochrysis_lutea.AAC.1
MCCCPAPHQPCWILTGYCLWDQSATTGCDGLQVRVKWKLVQNCGANLTKARLGISECSLLLWLVMLPEVCFN